MSVQNFYSFENATLTGLITHEFNSKQGNKVYFTRKLYEDGEFVKGALYKVVVLNIKTPLNIGDTIEVKGSLISALDVFEKKTFISKTIIVDLSKKYGNSIEKVTPTADMKIMISKFLKNKEKE